MSILKHLFMWIIIVIFFIQPDLPGDEWKTYYEMSGYKRTPSYSQTISYCKKIASASTLVKLTSFGISPQGRQLPLLIVDKNSNFKAGEVKKTGKIILLIQAGIHSGEIDGKDAGLMLIRDLVILKKYQNLLEHVTILFIPIFNVDGHERFGPYNRINQNGPEEMGWRVTSQNLNLNRDFLKADTPEMQSWLGLFNEWLPDFLVDCHVTDGADYQYTITYGIERHNNITAPIRELTTDLVLPYLDSKMNKAGFPLFPYIQFWDWNNFYSGLKAGTWSPRYSTGYGVVQNRIFFLVETHMLKDYKTRVTATYFLLKSILELVNEYSEKIGHANKRSDEITTHMQGKFFPLNIKSSNTDTVFIKFKGVEFEKKPSKISGADRIIYHSEKKKIYRMPYFNRVILSDSITVPYAYLIPPEWQEEIERLKLHGVIIHRLSKDTSLAVSSYRFSNIHWANSPYEGRLQPKFDVETTQEIRDYSKGTAVVFMNQRTNRVILHLLEPRAPDSFIAWGFWNVIFERKEYAESYVLEELAREMLRNNPELKKEFEQKLATDSSFAANPRARLYFFYKRSPYWDKKLNLYPVGKLIHPCRLALEKNNG